MTHWCKTMDLFLDCEQWVLLPPWTPPAREVLAAVWKRKTWSILLCSERRRANGQYTGSSSWSWGSTTRSSRCCQCGHIPFSFRHSPLRVQTLLSFPTPPPMSLLKTLFSLSEFLIQSSSSDWSPHWFFEWVWQRCWWWAKDLGS